MKRLLFLFILLLPSVFSIGISPASRTIEYVPGSEYTFTDTVSNNRDVPIDVIFSGSGELGKYVTMHQNATTLKAKGNTKFTYDFVIPDGLEPGTHKAYIGVQDDTQRGGGMFGIKVKVKGMILVKVPFPGRYAVMRLDVVNANEGENIPYSVIIENLGTEEISDSTLNIYVLDSAGNEKKVITHDLVVGPKSNNKVAGKIPGEFSKGKYTIYAEFIYDRTINKSMDFYIGAYEMEITKHSEHLYYRQITPFDTTVRSLWNGNLEDVYVTVEINEDEHESVSKFFYPLDGKKFTTYIDDTSFELNETYEAIITVHYGEFYASKTVTLDVVEYDGKIILEKPKKSELFDNIVKILIKPTTYLYIIIATLVLFNVSLLLKKKEKKKK